MVTQIPCPRGSACVDGAKIPCVPGSSYQSLPAQTFCNNCTAVCDQGLSITHTCNATTNSLCSDITPPVITLVGSSPYYLEAAQSLFVEPGFSAYDTRDLSLTVNVIVSPSSVLTSTVRSLNVSYSVADAAGNTALVQRLVVIRDTTAPILSLFGANNIVLPYNGGIFIDPGYSAIDAVDGNVTAKVSRTVVNITSSSWNYTYTVLDTAMNRASLSRIVTQALAPTLTIQLIGSNPLMVSVGSSFVDPGARAFASNGTNISASIVTTNSNSFSLSIPGSYSILYKVTSANISGNVSRAVVVKDTTAPVLVLTGPSSVTQQGGMSYVEPGATVSDNVDALSPANISISGLVNPFAPVGTVFTISYSTRDSAGNVASLTRTVTIIDTIPPVVSLNGISSEFIEATYAFQDLGASALDLHDHTLPVSIDFGGFTTRPTRTPVSFNVTYSAVDSANNVGTSYRIVTVRDTIAPNFDSVSLPNSIVVEVLSSLSPPQISASDLLDGNLVANVSSSTSYSPCTQVGSFALSYTASDRAGNAAAPLTVWFTVIDSVPPVINLTVPSFGILRGGYYLGTIVPTSFDAYASVYLNLVLPVELVAIYQLPPSTVAAVFPGGVSASKPPVWGDLPRLFFDPYIVSEYYPFAEAGTLFVWLYRTSDPSNNVAYANRTLLIVDDQPPTMFLTRSAVVYIDYNSSFVPTVVAIDILDGVLSNNVIITVKGPQGQVGGIDLITAASPVGSVYNLTYDVSDRAGNAAPSLYQQVVIVDQVSPILALDGPEVLTLAAGPAQFDASIWNASAWDEYDGNVTYLIVITGNGSASYFYTEGEYIRNYTAYDLSGNFAWVTVRIDVIGNYTVGSAPTAATSSSGGAGVALIGGIIAGVLIALVFVAILLFLLFNRRRSKTAPAVVSSSSSIATLIKPVVFSEGSLNDQEWFHGTITREEAEKRLIASELGTGAFLVRSKDVNVCTLSLLHNNIPKHYLISKPGEEWLFQAVPQPKWGSSVLDFINHLQANVTSAVPTLLLHPVPRPFSAVLTNGAYQYPENGAYLDPVTMAASGYSQVKKSPASGTVYYNSTDSVGSGYMQPVGGNADYSLAQANSTRMLENDSYVVLASSSTTDTDNAYIAVEPKIQDHQEPQYYSASQGALKPVFFSPLCFRRMLLGQGVMYAPIDGQDTYATPPVGLLDQYC